nr:ABC transporter ATP-binding protein [Nocardiopsis mwathae]
MRVLWSFVRPHRAALALGLVLALLGSALELATPMVIKLVLDTVSGSADLTGPIALLVALLVVGAGLGLWQWTLIGTVAERIVLDARTSLVDRYLRAALFPLSRRPAGELVTRVTSDTLLLREAASSSIIGLVNGVILLAGTLILMGVLDLVLLSVTIGAVVVVTVIFLTLMPMIARAQEQAQSALGRMGGVLEGTLRAIRTVKVSRAEGRMGDAVLADAHEAARHGVRSVRREALAWTVAYAGIQLAIIAILGVGALRVASGQIEVSTLIAFLLYAFTLMGPVTELSQNVTGLQSGLAAARRIREVEALPAEPAPTGTPDRARAAKAQASPASALLELRGVTARYTPGDRPAVTDVDLAIPATGHTAIVGPSGAGKTTVFSLLLRFLEPESGRLLLNGTPYDGLSPAEVRGRFAYVEQDTPVVPGTIRENLVFSAPTTGEDELWRVLGEVRLAEKVSALPDGLDTRLDTQSLSGGQRQRVALARALLATPEVLLLDEATAQVDAITEAAVTESVHRHSRHAAVVTIAHRLSTVINADRIIVMESGGVRAAGTHEELLHADTLYRELVEALRIEQRGDTAVLASAADGPPTA